MVESNDLLDESARKRREKFKRQDTPLHPETTPLGSVKRLSIPKSLSINMNSDSSHTSSYIRAISCDERQKSPTPRPLGQTTKHAKNQNLSSSPQNPVNILKLETAPRYDVNIFSSHSIFTPFNFIAKRNVFEIPTC